MKKKKIFDFSKLMQFKTAFVFATLAVLFFSFAGYALAIDTGLEYGTYTGLGTEDLRVTIMKIVRIALGFVGVIAIIIILYGGFTWMTSAGNPEKIDKAKKILQSAVIGLVIIFLAFAIVSFIIGVLEGGLVGPSIPPGPPPPQGVENGGHLGGGIIESVYPIPFARDVPRDTVIIVTFKVEIKPNTIINGAPESCTVSIPCSGNLAEDDGKPNVRIFKRSDGEDAGTLAADKVLVTSKDMKTFEFRPVAPLGDSVNKYYYTTKLTSNIIRKDTEEAAFPGGTNDYFSWDFEVGTRLDLTPPNLQGTFPPPDSLPDGYDAVSGTQASGSINILRQPRITQEASAEFKIVVGSVDAANLNGSYSGIYEGILTATVSNDGSELNISWPGTGFTAPGDYFFNPISIDPVTKRADLRWGLSVVFNEISGGNQFTIRLRPKTNADVLQISNKIYTFVDQNNPSPGENEIKIEGVPGEDGDKNVLRNRIEDKIDLQTEYPNILATKIGNDTVGLIAEKAGLDGNYINISTTEGSNWAQITPMAGGSDESTNVTCSSNGLCDQPRNVIIRIDFNEPVLPSEASGIVATDNSNSIDGAGKFAADGSDFENIIVEADLDNSNNFEDNEKIAGTFVLSNQHKTVEFISLQPCQGVQYNSCGDQIFCLPVNPEINPIKYRVRIKTAKLKADFTDANQCAGLSYEDGTTLTEELIGSSCGKTASPKNIYYMKSAAADRLGIVDLSSNLFDGNKDGYVQGGLNNSISNSFYNLNSPDAAFGDDLEFSFYINNKMELNPPVVVKVSPKVNNAGQSLISPVSSTYNKLLQSSSLRPGWGYKDGKCTCDINDDCISGQQNCQLVNDIKYCVNTGGAQEYCARDSECASGKKCVTKRYISLFDEASTKVGWWIGNYGEDVRMCINNKDYIYKECTSDAQCGTGGLCSLIDSYADRTIAQINHTPFLELTKYNAEIASGVRDIYQNCFVPGKGPKIEACNPYDPTGCCGVSNGSPYCCNGSPYSAASWANTVCGQIVGRNFK